jgi:hypothetical protein
VDRGPIHLIVISTTERLLASPLNVAMPISAYWSLHERDRRFGGNWKTYRECVHIQSVNSGTGTSECGNPSLNTPILALLLSVQAITEMGPAKCAADNYTHLA